MKSALAAALLIGAASVAAPAAAAVFTFSISGNGQTGTGSLTTADTVSPNARGGYVAYAITGITGALNGSAITGLNGFLGSDNLYYTTGPAFLDGSGLGFMTAAGTTASLYYQDSIPSYRITTTSPFASVFVTATSAAAAAVPEPASWAMMLGGFGLVGLGLRRRTGTRLQAV